jgi:hypothetical protein
MTREEAIKYWDFLEGKEIEAIHTLIPESEDERIINAIISYLRMTSLYSSNGCKKPEMIDWLEKQKEQHPSFRFHPGDWVVYDGPLGHAILQVKDVLEGRYTFVDNDSTLLVEDSDKFLRPLTPKDVEKKVEWSEEDEETIGTLINYFEGDALDYSTDEMIRRIRALRPSWKPSKEQMEVLLSTQDMVRASGYRQNAKVLASLYEQLKKL